MIEEYGLLDELHNCKTKKEVDEFYRRLGGNRTTSVSKTAVDKIEGKRMKQCKNCGKEFEEGSLNNEEFCSDDCNFEYYKDQLGEE